MREELALKYFNNGYNCSQAILGAFCEEYGMDLEKACKMAVAFGGGVGRQGKMCGCISGALMVLGLRYGEGSTENLATRIKNYELGKKLCKEFIEVNGALDCRDIIKYNLNNIEERNKAQQDNVFQNRCSEVVVNTAKLLETFLVCNE
jgi:C_GCAxxG_C_C family probable redox protein